MLAVGYGYLISGADLELTKRTLLDIVTFKVKDENKYIVLYNRKYLLTKNPYTNLYLDSFKLSDLQIQIFQTFFNTTDNPGFYVIRVDTLENLDSLRLLTFNLDLALYYNETHKIKPDVKSLNELCMMEYGKNGHKVCINNSIDWIYKQNADIIGLQEVGPGLIPSIMNKFGSDYSYINNYTEVIIYNSEKLGAAKILNLKQNRFSNGKRDNDKKRNIVALWFERIKLLVFNLRAPHSLGIGPTVERFLNHGDYQHIVPKRIIAMGDFNDTLDNPLVELVIRGLTLKQHGPAPHSCCTDSKYIYTGDYIFDSAYELPGFYGIPEDVKVNFEYNERNSPTYISGPLMSDHYPVVFYPGV